MHSPDDQAQLSRSLAEFTSLVHAADYEAAILLFEAFPDYIRHPASTTEYTLQASKAYTELASNEPDKAKRDRLFAKAVRAATE